MGIKPRIRVIAGGGLGDSILLTPCIRSLRDKFPQTKIKVYCRDSLHAKVWECNPHVDAVTTFSSFHDRIWNIARRIGFGNFYWHAPYGNFSPCTQYRAVSATHLMAELLNVEVTDERPEIFLRKEEIEAAKELLRRYRRPLICVHPITAKALKNWPLQRWERVISSNPQYTFIQLGEDGEPPLQGADSFLGIDLRLVFAVIHLCDGFVGSDSSLAHVAAAVGTPAAVLFGPASPGIWGHSYHVNLYKNPGCSPCVDLLKQASCPFGQRCLEDISVAEVSEALKTITARRSDFESSRPSRVPHTLQEVARCSS